MDKVDNWVQEVKKDPAKVSEAVADVLGVPRFKVGEAVQITIGTVGYGISGTSGTYEGPAGNSGYSNIKLPNGAIVPVLTYYLQKRENNMGGSASV